MLILKLEAARIQLDSAIEHFFRDDHVCAVTLAGAAEDILAGLLKTSGEQSPFESLYDWYQSTYNTAVSKGNFSQQIANPARNWLKHANKDVDTELDITEKDSILMIMRALPCYYKLTKSHTEQMDKFHQYKQINVSEIDKLFS